MADEREDEGWMEIGDLITITQGPELDDGTFRAELALKKDKEDKTQCQVVFVVDAGLFREMFEPGDRYKIILKRVTSDS